MVEGLGIERRAAEGGDGAATSEEPVSQTSSAPSTEAAESSGPLGRWERLQEGVQRGLLRWRPVAWLKSYLDPRLGRQKLIAHVAAIVLLGVAPLWIIGAFLETYCTERVLWSVMADVRVAVFEKLSRMSLSFFGGRRTGDLISRLTNDITTTRGAARLLFSDVLKHPIKLGILLAVAFWASWPLTLIVLLCTPPVAWIMRRYGGRIQKYGRKSLEKIGDITDSISQMFSGIRVVKAFNMEEQENAEFRERNRQQLRRAFKLVRNRAWADCLPQAVVVICFGVVLLVANHLLDAGVIELSNLFVLVPAVALMPRSIKRTVKCYSKLREQLGAMDRIFELVDAENTLADAPDARELTGVRQGIRFRHVWFAYEDEQFVLKDVDHHVSCGTVCAVVGETGAGKSTMLDLVPRFYDVQRGAVEIDGIDVRKLTHESLLRQVAIVGQHPFLFNRTIAENIRYGRPEASDEEVVAAARAAHVHEFIEGLPEGYDTVVGEQGSRLSGGQRQCLTIARALLKDAPILILDEATSNLDSESERLVQEALGSLMQGRTVFVIAHRLSTVRLADLITVLKDGQMVERGTHQELLAKDGEYAKLYRIQFREPEGPAESGAEGAL
jgi:subfamily B ATP-binding cassette protein MsbA